jgi:hypothetical protein
MPLSSNRTQKRARKPSYGELEKNVLKTKKKQTFACAGSTALPTLYIFAFGRAREKSF